MSDSLWPHGLQHARPPCPSPTPGAYSNSCPLSQWRHPAISSSFIPFSSCLQSFPASGPLPRSVLHIRWPKYWNFNFSISPSNEYSGLISFRMDWFDLLAVQGTLLQHHSSKASILWHGLTLTSIHDYWKNHSFDYKHLCWQSNVSLFNILSRLVIVFLPRIKHLLISWLQSLSSVILESKKMKSVTLSIVSPSICHEVMGLDTMILAFCMLSFKPALSLSSFTFIKMFFSSSLLSAIRLAYSQINNS